MEEISQAIPEAQWPTISILIAARNEAHQIAHCLQAIALIDYPSGRWEVLIGDDASTDNTASVIEETIGHLPNFSLLSINTTLGEAKGKANVLAHLAKKAKGELLLCTDADIIVPATWAKAMVSQWTSEVGIITGFTLVNGKGPWAKLQGVDWTWALMLVKLASDLGIPTTAMGNNMLLSKKAYQSVGGYESLPFSVTEDYALFKALVSKGWQFKQLINREVMAYTPSIDEWPELMRQRKRWLHGAIQVPWYLQLSLWLQVGWLPLMLVIGYFSVFWAIALWGGKILIQSLAIMAQLSQLRLYSFIPQVLLYDFYLNVVYPAMVWEYFRSKQVQWKGRVYH